MTVLLPYSHPKTRKRDPSDIATHTITTQKTKNWAAAHTIMTILDHTRILT